MRTPKIPFRRFQTSCFGLVGFEGKLEFEGTLAYVSGVPLCTARISAKRKRGSRGPHRAKVAFASLSNIERHLTRPRLDVANRSTIHPYHCY